MLNKCYVKHIHTIQVKEASTIINVRQIKRKVGKQRKNMTIHIKEYNSLQFNQV